MSPVAPRRRGLSFAIAFLLVAPNGVGLGATVALSAAASPHDTSRAIPSFPGGLLGSLGPRASVGAHPLAGGAVDPYALLGTNPSQAPIGVGDFGVDGNGNAYTYSTSMFEGTLNISRLSASSSSSGPYVGFQLNVVLRLTTGGVSPTTLAYWIQDVAVLNTSANAIEFLNNVWNLSSPGALLAAGELSGNGTTASCGSGCALYAASPACNTHQFPGNCVVLAYPQVLGMRVTTGTFAGVPHVTFAYNVQGVGWIVYDNVSWLRGGNWHDVGFTVDGTQYTPLGVFWDAEWVYTGPGSGATTIDRNSSLQMTLQFWNGHDFQSVPNAYNFGSNTGEMVRSVAEALLADPANGTLGDSVTTGTLGVGSLYTRNYADLLTVESPNASAGTLWVGGEGHPFVGGAAVLELAPGTYALRLANATRTIAYANVTLPTGGTTTITMSPAARFGGTVVASGLPSGTMTELTVNGVVYSVASAAVLPALPNGTYPYSVAPIAGFYPNAYNGTFSVSGGTYTLSVVWHVFTFPITFVETGLPTGTTWGVEVGSVVHSSTGTTVVVGGPNGTFAYTVTAGITYSAQPGTGAYTVTGASGSVVVAFSLRPGYIAGIVSPGNASIWIDGVGEPNNLGVVNVSLLPGVHALEVSEFGFTAYYANLTVTPGATTPIDVILNALPSSGSPGTTPGGGTGSANASASGLPLTTALLVIGAIVAVAIVALALIASRRRPARRPPRRG